MAAWGGELFPAADGRAAWECPNSQANAGEVAAGVSETSAWKGGGRQFFPGISTTSLHRGGVSRFFMPSFKKTRRGRPPLEIELAQKSA